jgi:hypothetical protein
MWLYLIRIRSADLDGHDLHAYRIEDRKAQVDKLLKAAACPRVVYVSHVIGKGDRLFDAAQRVGAEGIVSKRIGSRYKGGPTRDWMKTKVSETGTFVVTGFTEVAPMRLEARVPSQGDVIDSRCSCCLRTSKLTGFVMNSAAPSSAARRRRSSSP